jgi:hypothetical protein
MKVALRVPYLEPRSCLFVSLIYALPPITFDDVVEDTGKFLPFPRDRLRTRDKVDLLGFSGLIRPSQKSLPPSLFQREESLFSLSRKRYGFPPLKKGDQGGFLEGPGHAELYSPF